ncbi:MAG TPA: OFA family MFS transporter [Ktedonosporobacter sp.]|nr:OFA family MFS transporter [Ktedonosporobacter sp.]
MSSTSAANPSASNRWVIAIAAFAMQLALGAVYAWSTFLPTVQKVFFSAAVNATTGAPLASSKPIANATFSVILAVLGITAGFGGYLNSRFGPRVIATVAGIFYGVGTLLSALVTAFAPNIFLLYITDGLIGGIGLGLGYIVAIAMLLKWFPDRRGFITGLAVAGFGGGAAITAPIAAALLGSTNKLTASALQGNLTTTFLILGIIYLVVVIAAAQFFRTAPDGYAPAGWTPTPKPQAISTKRDYALRESLTSPKWYVLWLTLALNVTAGAALISVVSPMAQTITGVTAIVASTLVITLSVFNAVGRLFWAWLSEVLGRPYTFLSIFIVQVVAFALIPLFIGPAGSLALLYIPVSLIGLCYGGGFGTMPAFAADFFGAKNAGTIYGVMLTAWSAGGIVGPLLIASFGNNYATPIYIIIGILVVSCALPFVARVLARQPEAVEVVAGS